MQHCYWGSLKKKDIFICLFVCLFTLLGHSSVVEHLSMVWWIVGSILHGGTIDLFLIPASAPQLA